MKFQKGDIITGKRNNGYYVTTEGWVGRVLEYPVDKECVLSDDPMKVASLDDDQETYYVDNDDAKFSLYGKREEKIVIVRDGDKTIATKYVNGHKTAVGSARCSDDDVFDFRVGASLAFERLMLADKPETTKVKKYWNGKVICVHYHSVYFDYGKVYPVVDGKLIDNTGTVYDDMMRFENVQGIIQRYGEGSFMEYTGEVTV